MGGVASISGFGLGFLRLVYIWDGHGLWIMITDGHEQTN
jgi:hypothetical protein